VAGLVALDEVVLHGWDLAKATGQPHHVEPQLLVAVRRSCGTAMMAGCRAESPSWPSTP
jgi:hypothetical protein